MRAILAVLAGMGCLVVIASLCAGSVWLLEKGLDLHPQQAVTVFSWLVLVVVFGALGYVVWGKS